MAFVDVAATIETVVADGVLDFVTVEVNPRFNDRVGPKNV
jgi:hypothetical protein